MAGSWNGCQWQRVLAPTLTDGTERPEARQRASGVDRTEVRAGAACDNARRMADLDLTSLERDLAAQPDSAVAHARLVHAYARVGRLAEAGRCADRASDLDPQFEELALRWGDWRSVSRNAARTAAVEHSLWPAESRPTMRWRHALTASNAPVIAEGLVLVPGDRRVHALDLGTGAVIWQGALLQEPLSAVAVARGLLVVMDDRGVHAFELSDGHLAWSCEPASALRGASHVTVARGTVVALGNGHLAGIDLSSGATTWSLPWPNAPVPPACRGGRVLVPGHSLGVVDLTTGDIVHRRNATDSDECVDTALIGPDAAGYVGTIRWGEALDLTTGETLASDPLGEGRGAQCMALTEHLVVIQTSTTVAAAPVGLGEDELLWETGLDAPDMGWGAVVAGTLVLAGDAAHGLVALDALTGARVFSAPFPTWCRWRPALAPGVLVGAGDGEVFALAFE